jgi:hypothetical protein
VRINLSQLVKPQTLKYLIAYLTYIYILTFEVNKNGTPNTILKKLLVTRINRIKQYEMVCSIHKTQGVKKVAEQLNRFGVNCYCPYIQ